MSATIPRSEWGARYGHGDPMRAPASRVVIHHSYRPALSPSATPETEREAVRGIERHHAETNGWSGIGYNWLVAPSGRTYEGQGWGRVGAHAKGVNSVSVGICLLMDGGVDNPTSRAISAVRDLIAVGIARGHIGRGYHLTGHRDHADTDCPGDLVYPRLAEFRHDYWQEVPAPSGELAVPTAEPAAPEPPNLERIIVPTPEHIDEAVRVSSRWDADSVRDGIALVEVILRGMQRGNVRQIAPAIIANVLSEWLNRR